MCIYIYVHVVHTYICICAAHQFSCMCIQSPVHKWSACCWSLRCKKDCFTLTMVMNGSICVLVLAILLKVYTCTYAQCTHLHVCTLITRNILRSKLSLGTCLHMFIQNSSWVNLILTIKYAGKATKRFVVSRHSVLKFKCLSNNLRWKLPIHRNCLFGLVNFVQKISLQIIIVQIEFFRKIYVVKM